MAMQKIKVPQKSGGITIDTGDGAPTVYRVSDGEVSVKDEDADRFIAAVPGAKRA